MKHKEVYYLFMVYGLAIGVNLCASIFWFLEGKLISGIISSVVTIGWTIISIVQVNRFSRLG